VDPAIIIKPENGVLMNINGRQLFATKPVQAIDELEDPYDPQSGGALERVLGPGALIALGVGVIIGTGIFVLTGVVAAKHAGPALTLSFLLAALGCGLAGLCYAEFASLIPRSGSAYT
jgi:APA family basic amino acid/polyamine antiporter